jgi:hypothetical protein
MPEPAHPAVAVLQCRVEINHRQAYALANPVERPTDEWRRARQELEQR